MQFSNVFGAKDKRLFIFKNITNIDRKFVFHFLALSLIGLISIYSANKGMISGLLIKQLGVFVLFGPLLFIFIPALNIKYIIKYCHFYYIAIMIFIILVYLTGHIAMGARRWIDLGFMRFQPSEFIKTAIILSLARYFHFTRIELTGRLTTYFIPLILIAVPSCLVILQPDLGTAILIITIGAAIIFVSGISSVFVIAILALCTVLVPVGWSKMHDYQKQRVRTFLDPTKDPFGSGYHVIQSQIAVGSGGIFGKGLLRGSQSQLDFIPEDHTDFIFTHFSEEFGLVGCIVLLYIYTYMVLYGYKIALSADSHFVRIVAIGLSFSLFIHVFINIGMTIGLLPVVGTSLPVMSYGGSFLLSNLINFAILLNLHINKRTELDTSKETFL